MNTTPTKRRSPWPYAIAGLLAAHVGAMVLAVQIAGGSGGHTLLPEYQDRAESWDAARAADARSAELGWTLDVAPAALGDGTGHRTVTLTLRDAAGDPVDGAQVSLRLYHLAVGDRVEVEARPDGAGRYLALAPLERAGDYSFETRATFSGEAGAAPPLEFRDLRTVHLVALAEAVR